ncbi:dTDP-glucose 4,6-dehydratase [Candidatus Uhrbacteria bacterium]|nr:dTDP-glucose 4,6-dehydratase [Candidatus Uhrbacteria bacterium]
MKILITGGCGFMGSNFIRYVLEQYPDYSVINLDALTYAGNPENLKSVENDPRYTFVKGNITDEKFVQSVMEQGIDVIINYAAETHVDRSISDPKAFILTDVLGTYTLLEAARTFQTPRYIQISTDEVYGSIEEGVFTEESPFLPNSPYAASKASGDMLCRAYVQTYGLPIIVTHSCNFYGPYQYPEKVIPLFITNLIEGKKVPLYGDGKNVREWIYTEDHCNAICMLLEKGVLGEVYTIGTGYEIPNVDLTMKLLEYAGCDTDMIEYVKDRPGHDRRYALDSSKLRALGWAPKYSFEEGLERTVQWYKDNSEWWKKIKSGEYKEYYQRQYEKR